MIINLEFDFSIDSEIKRVDNTLAKLDWYKNNGYNPNLPSNLKNIKESVQEEYEESLFIKAKNKILADWGKYQIDMPQKLQHLGLNFHSVYKIQLTKYGVRGSYNLPNLIILNIRDRESSDIIRTIIHEIIHLCIEDWIIESKVLHWQKERLVDLIFERIYPEMNKMREPKDGSQIIDEIFKTYFPDIKKVIKSI